MNRDDIRKSRVISSGRAAFCVAFACCAGTAAGIEFEETTATSGILYSGETWGSSWGDLNSDGRPDLYTNNHRLKDSIWLNNGDGTFSDVTNVVDIDGVFSQETTSDTHSGTWADFDNDGDKDLVISNGYNGRSASGSGWRFFVNENGALLNRTAQMGLTYTASSGGRFPGWSDVNNDGKLDLWVMSQSGSRDAELFIANASGGFTNTSGTYHDCRSNHFMMLSDIDLDGRMEVLCSAKNNFPNKVYDTSTYPSLFSDETASIPLKTQTQDTAIVDFNNDLRPDIFHVRGGKRLTGANQYAPTNMESQLIADNSKEVGFSFNSSGVLSIIQHWEYHSETSTTYIGANGVHPSSLNYTLDPANPSTWGIKSRSPSYGPHRGIYIGFDPATQMWQFYLSPGGNVWNLASFQVASTSDITNLLSIGLLATDKPTKPSLLLNQPGGWQEDLKAAGLNTALSCVGAASGDFDNDGDIDLYLVCREASANIANILYENQGNATFVKVANAGGAEGVIGAAQGQGAGTGDIATVADYDGDGLLDLFVTNGLNETDLRTGGPHQLFRNRTNNGNHWIQIDLRGVVSNRDGIGAKVFVTTPNLAQQLREQNGGFHRWSQDQMRLHFGLADQTTADIRVEWPSGAVDNFTGVAADHIYRATEQGGIVLNDFPPPPAPGVPITAWTGAFGGVTVVDNSVFYSGTPSTGWTNTVNSASLSSLGATGTFEVRWTVGSDPSVTLWMAGLGVTESSKSWTDIDYGWRNSNGTLQIYESGAYVTDASGALAAGEKLSILVSGSTLQYRRNGAVILTRTFSDTPDFYIDTSFRSGATSLEGFTLHGE